MQVQRNEDQSHAQVQARAWLRSLRHVDTTLDLLLYEERFLQHVVSTTDEDIVCNASLALDAEASSFIAREAVTFLSKIIQTPHMRAIDDASASPAPAPAPVSALAKANPRQRGSGSGPHGSHCNCIETR